MARTDVLSIPTELLGGGDSSRMLLLNLQDDAMSDAGITNGDWVIIREQDEAEDGAVVAVMHNGDAIVRRLNRGCDGTVSFTATGCSPIPGNQATIIGLGAAVIRLI